MVDWEFARLHRGHGGNTDLEVEKGLYIVDLPGLRGGTGAGHTALNVSLRLPSILEDVEALERYIRSLVATLWKDCGQHAQGGSRASHPFTSCCAGQGGCLLCGRPGCCREEALLLSEVPASSPALLRCQVQQQPGRAEGPS